MMPKLITGSATVSQLGTSQGRDTQNSVSQNLNPDNFAALIQKNGLSVIWEKALMCPFRTNEPSPDTHDPNCKICNGEGYTYIDPIPTTMLISGATIEQTFYIQGRFDMGIAQISALPGVLIGYWDRVTLDQSVIRHTQTMQRGEGTNKDLLRYKALDVLHVQYQGQVFTKNRDYTLVDNQIVWTVNESARPPSAEFYAVLYTRRPIYIILNLQHQHRDVQDTVAGTSRQMPLQATAKLDFLVRDESRDPAPSKADSPFPDPVRRVSGVKD